MDLYTAAKKAGLEIDHHESDLYLKHSEQATNLIAVYDTGNTATVFRSEIDGELWWDIPFAYLPYWEARRVTA